MVDVKIGIEIHGYLKMSKTGRKLFCQCKISTSDAEPNIHTCPVCSGQPGSKPMNVNSEAIEKVIACARILGCKVNTELLFQRKHYSWPDLPHGFQKTMSGAYAAPTGEDGEFLGIRIEECHLEEDPARWDPVTGTVDYNRSGFPLIEIVTAPDFRSSSEVRQWLKKMLRMLGYVDAIDASAGIKCDVNVSIGPDFVRTEVKNVNSLAAIEKAIEYEISRQQKEVAAGTQEGMQTRAWDDASGTTKFMRKKESVSDYMFIPEPDLPIIPISQELLDSVEDALPERPEVKVARFKEWRVDDTDAEVIAMELDLATLFEAVAKKVDPVLAAKWLRRELLRVLNYNDTTLADVTLDEAHIVELLELVEKKTINETTAKRILEKLIVDPFSPKAYVAEHGLAQVQDSDQLATWCDEVIASQEKAVGEFKAGEEKALNFLVGQVMRLSRGKANPQEVSSILKGKLQ